MWHQRNSRPGTRREITPVHCEGKPEITREWSGAGTAAHTKRSVTPAREPTLRERKTRPEPREEARGASVLSRGRRIRQTLAQL
ncbi:hypothetical protein ACLOJD_10370 [Rothia dentocariosa]|uniref:hypothetical protein n=1 Tax=Rothia dentocariosa TaxID=2047 RepID=UPI003A8A7426